MNGTDGFIMAKDILKRKFGQNYMVARAFIDEIIDGPPVKNDDSAALADLSQKMQTCVVTLKQLGYQSDLNASRTLEAIVARLPSNLRFKWAETAVDYMKQDTEPTFEDLARFIEERVNIMCTRYGELAANLKSDKRVRNVVSSQPPSTKRNVFTLKHSPSSQRQERYLVCILCKDNHFLDQCPTLLSLEVDKRLDLIKEKRLCRLCLKANHIAKDCRLRRGCTVEGCGGRHHTLLHVTTDVSPSNANVATNYVSNSRAENEEPKVAFAVVPVILRNRDRTVETLAFLDSGSDSTLVLKDIVDDLKLPMEYARVRIETMNGYREMRTNAVQLEASSYESDESIRIERAYVVPSLPKIKRVVPEEKQLRLWQHLQGIDLRRCESKRIGLLVGCNVPEAHRNLEQRLGRPEEPYAIKTIFGWTLIGPLGTHVTRHIKPNHLSLSEIESTLERFYQQDLLEESQSKDKDLSIEDRTALRIMEKSITLKDCHYCISLPWKDSQLEWTDNKSYCLHRLNALRKRLCTSKDLARRYADAMKDYLIKGYAEIAPPLNDNSNVWYLPHHPVVHPAKPEKIRIVFDCAAKHEGRSLNDRLLSGPDLTNSLLGVILRFRQERVAVMADIEAMFHQVKVPECDRDALRFLWWTNGDFTDSPEELRMTVHLFGATSSPSCATFALNRTIKDNKENYDKEVYDMATRSFYVDDCLISTPNTETSYRVATQLKDMLSKGGFNLTKWITNDSTLAQLLPEFNCIGPCVHIGHGDHTTCRALGISWNISDDTFRFYVGRVNEPVTRRNVLSFVASIFDPMGYLAPVILPAKLILQKLCKMKFSWDDLIVGEELKVWRKWQGSLTHIEKIVLPRSLNAAECTGIELHMFSDASNNGYGAAGYLLLLKQQSVKECRLIFAKAKVAPIRATSIPRLELAAAVLSVKISKFIRTEMTVTILKTVYWTDSLVVLHSINNASKRFPTFFANRLVYIQEQTRPSDWRYVSSKLNPADLLSRGFIVNQERKLKRWLSGPTFLLQGYVQQEPHQNTNACSYINYMLSNKDLYPNENQPTFLSRFEAVNSWMKLQRMIAWLLRYKHLLMNKLTNQQNLTVAELRAAELNIIRLAQKECFNDVFKLLNHVPVVTSEKEVDRTIKVALCKSSSPLRHLKPITVNGVIRVGGRLQQSGLPFEVRHPIILPHNHFITRLIIRHYHEANGHMGVNFLISTISERYWIIKAVKTIKSVLNNCYKCRKWFSQPCQQAMAPLPEDRFMYHCNPFTVTGVDYFGPLFVKRGRTVEKRYGCLFTCFSSRAVHLEISNTLDTDSFLCVFSRFAARRGYPQRLYSDNGSNFKGAERAIKCLMRAWNQEKISKNLAAHNCDWIFNPPKAYHRGGIWERIIKTIKRILVVVLDEQPVTDEVLHTTLVEIERILNNRPIVKMVEDVDGIQALSPSMLLLPRASEPASIDEKDYTTNYNRRWRQTLYLVDLFWKRWLKLYIPTLQLTQRWHDPKPNLKVGDLVLMIESARSRGQWPKAVVTDIQEGTDGLVRKVTLRTANGTVRRDVRQLCKLEGEVEESQNPEQLETSQDSSTSGGSVGFSCNGCTTHE
ncbi:unnamed protein product [Schistosoma turkestanicum]|nr:unnamed protein product [Schistosoma turkestanicum]